MTNLVLDIEKASQLGRMFARVVGTQSMIMEAVKNGDFDMASYNFIVKKHKLELSHLKHFFNKFERIEVPKDQYYEGRLNAYRMALGV